MPSKEWEGALGLKGISHENEILAAVTAALLSH